MLEGAADEHLAVHRLGALTISDSEELSTGTERQPSSSRPSSLTTRVHTRSQWARRRSSRGMKMWPTRVAAGRGQREAELLALLLEEVVRDLNEHAGAVAGQRVGAHRAAVLEVGEDLERVGDDLMRLAALEVGDEADAAGIVLVRRVVKALRPRRLEAFESLGFAWLFLGSSSYCDLGAGTLQRANLLNSDGSAEPH